MSETNSFVAPSRSRIPLAVNNLQYNFCKNPTCENFGIEPEQTSKRGSGSKGRYAIVGGAKALPLLKCNCCGETPPLKSNQGIADEFNRLSAYLNLKNSLQVPTCPNADCANHSVPVGTKKAYRSFGKASSGAKRYQCSLCKKTFSISKPTKGQHETHHNIEIFNLLVNKVPLSRIVNILGISWDVLYHRIDFIHQQCVKFVSSRESKLKTLPIKRLYLAIDKQDYEINWTERKDKRNVILKAVASADNATGYVFGIHPNFDSSLDKEAIEIDAKALNDASLPDPFKKYARLWLEADYRKASHSYSKKRMTDTLTDSIAETYEQANNRDDVEAFDTKAKEHKLPNRGAQIRAEYTMIAHFYFLKSMLGNVGKWRFFLDQESGIRSACLSAFKDEIREKRAEAFYVSIAKGFTVDEKRKAKRDVLKQLEDIKLQNPSYSDEQAKLELLKAEIQSVKTIGAWKDRWVNHPLPSMSESNKAMCWLTEYQEFDLDHQAWLYNKASLHGVDSFFEKVRRRIAMFERPIHSPGNGGRTWNGYACYNPERVGKMLEIFRVVHNYIDVRKENGMATTPAMRLGLANAPLDYKNVLYFKG